ncbi:MAG: hypothetical protein LBJ10_12050 [Clostridiales bacterium]|jgi:hypothetical protein|nr:hypothetical protein [Clostridiales bacterium]
MDCAGFSVRIKRRGFEVLLGGEPAFDFSARCAVSSPEADDIDLDILTFDAAKTPEGLVATWKTRSSLWESKAYVLRCAQDACRFQVTVGGKGRLGRADYFSGAAGAEAAGSYYDASEYFLPVAMGGLDDNRYYPTVRSSEIGLGYMTPPPLCYPFRMEGADGWLGVGLVARDGEYSFDRFSYSCNAGIGCFFSADFAGHTAVDGSCALPEILICGGGNEYSVLGSYADWHFRNGACRPRSGALENWWRGPLFCGWGEQCGLAAAGNPGDLATQAEYARMSDTLDRLGIPVTAIIIDAKWQAAFGELLPDAGKWPDLRGFADWQHSKGRRILLWLKAWDSEGLPSDECVTLWGQQIGTDPTNPKYAKRLRETFHRLLSPDGGCFNCDGFKIDFANCMPLGKDIAAYEKGVYGIEMLKRMLALMHGAAKAAKKDALINNSACHPYFAEVTDQARIHDYGLHSRSAEAQLRQRVGIYRAAMPFALIDTDGAGWTSRRDTMRYMRVAATLGVPDLYRLTAGCLADGDMAEIAEIFRAYHGSANSGGEGAGNGNSAANGAASRAAYGAGNGTAYGAGNDNGTAYGTANSAANGTAGSTAYGAGTGAGAASRTAYGAGASDGTATGAASRAANSGGEGAP